MRRRPFIQLTSAGLGAAWLLPAHAQTALPGPDLPDPWRTRPIPNRLLTPQYRPPGAQRFKPISWVEALSRWGDRILKLRSTGWNPQLRRTEGLGFHLGTDLTNEEAYTWAKFARLVGGRLERQGERGALAIINALDTTFGQPAAPNHWSELSGSRSILLLGNALDRPYPAYQAISAALGRGARVWSVSEGSPRNLGGGAAMKLAPQSELALLGGLIHYLLQSDRLDIDYIEANTNALYRTQPDFTFLEGVFSGFNRAQRRYSPDTWSYEFLENGLPGQARDLDSDGTVFSRLVSFFDRFRPSLVSRITAVPEPVLLRFFKEIIDPTRRPLSLVYTLDNPSETALSEQKLRASAIVSLLCGEVGRPGGGLVVLTPGWNPQGTADVGALGSWLPGYSGLAPREDEDLIDWVQRNGVRDQRRLVAVLASWFDASKEPERGFEYLPRVRPGEPALADSKLDMLVCIGSDPRLEDKWPRLGEIKTLVVLATDSQNRTARFWENKNARTEVLFLPLAHPIEREGTVTDTGRRIVFQTAERPPQGESRTALTLVDQLWNQLQPAVQQSVEQRDASLRAARWPQNLTPAAALAEMAGQNLSDPWQIDRNDQPGSLPCGVPVYAGLRRDGENLAERRSTEDRSGLGLFLDYGYTWPGNVHVLGNRASADRAGRARVQPAFLSWNGDIWTGPDVPDITPTARPTGPEGVRPFRGTPEGVARLFAANFASGLNLNTGIAFNRAALPVLGPLPAYYVPWGSNRPNLLNPEQAEPPIPPS